MIHFFAKPFFSLKTVHVSCFSVYFDILHWTEHIRAFFVMTRSFSSYIFRMANVGRRFLVKIERFLEYCVKVQKNNKILLTKIFFIFIFGFTTSQSSCVPILNNIRAGMHEKWRLFYHSCIFDIGNQRTVFRLKF